MENAAVTEEAVAEYFLKKQYDGSVIYVAEIDLEKHRLGKNVSFECQYSRQKTPIGKTETTLRTEKGEDGNFYLITDTPKSELQLDLGESFDDKGRLQVNNVLGGEFYLDDYQSPRDLENERIYRFIEGKPVDITGEVAMLRADIESRAEFTRGINRS